MVYDGYYGVDGVMSRGWDTEDEAYQALLDDYFDDRDVLDIVEMWPGEWVLAY